MYINKNYIFPTYKLPNLPRLALATCAPIHAYKTQ